MAEAAGNGAAINLPDRVSICEVGPRDGFQFEAVPVPTDLKVEIIRGLADAGIPRIQATSFVHPRWVPQMADAEEVYAAVKDFESTVITTLVLNEKGLERAAKAGVTNVDLSIATNETHAKDNANMTVAEGISMAERIVADAIDAGMSIQLGLQTVFGYDRAGDTDVGMLSEVIARFAGMGVESISLADTTGLAHPVLVTNYLSRFLTLASGVPLVLHLHDTRGLGLANVVTAMELGVNRFDASLGGMGGCPFIPGAAGNIATEDLVHLCESMSVTTGIDMGAVARCSRIMEKHRGQSLPGKLYELVADL